MRTLQTTRVLWFQPRICHFKTLNATSTVNRIWDSTKTANTSRENTDSLSHWCHLFQLFWKWKIKHTLFFTLRRQNAGLWVCGGDWTVGKMFPLVFKKITCLDVGDDLMFIYRRSYWSCDSSAHTSSTTHDWTCLRSRLRVALHNNTVYLHVMVYMTECF